MRSVGPSLDGSVIAIAQRSRDENINLYEITTGRMLRAFPRIGEATELVGMALPLELGHGVIVGMEMVGIHWSARSTSWLNGPQVYATALDFSADGRRLAIGPRAVSMGLCARPARLVSDPACPRRANDRPDTRRQGGRCCHVRPRGHLRGQFGTGDDRPETGNFAPP